MLTQVINNATNNDTTEQRHETAAPQIPRPGGAAENHKIVFQPVFQENHVHERTGKKFDFSLSELKALSAFVDINAEYTLSELSNNARVPPSNMTPVIKRLEKKNMVKKFRDPGDERYVHICLSAARTAVAGAIYATEGA
ncbi:MAG: MarR family transcriptional regulator [Desulfosudis oleivorans]|nr:MarR family transcriptional regulator [Desulfosudis oleivorans]